MSLLSLGKLLTERRGGRGVREFAKEIGISPATLSRIENGKLPDIETFSKICSYLKLDPAEILQVELGAPGRMSVPSPSPLRPFISRPRGRSTPLQRRIWDL